MSEKNCNYTEEELNNFDEESKEFYQIWVKLHAEKGAANYIHMFTCGHIWEQMKKWGNLNRYSQQGWEALNALMKLFFYRRTNKGGHKSGDDEMSCNGARSKLIPIIRLVQRRVLFLCKIINSDDPDVMEQITSNKRTHADGESIINEEEEDIVLGLPTEE